MNQETGSIHLYGTPFPVLWQSRDRRQFANRDKCYELVPFEGLDESVLDALRRGPPIDIGKYWLPNLDYKRSASREYHEWQHATGRGYDQRGHHRPPEVNGFYCPPKARGLRFINPKAPQVSRSAMKNTQASIDLLAIGRALFHVPCGGPGAVLLSESGAPIFMLTFGNGDIRFVKDVVECPIPSDARQYFILDSLAAPTQGEAAAAATSQPQPKEASPLIPPDINETVLWHVQQGIMDELDTKLKSAPAASQVFVRYCRDRMTLVKMHKAYGWNYRTLKERKRLLQSFLRSKFKLTLEAFFVDRAIFSAALRQLSDHRAKHISPRAVGECQTGGGEEEGE